MQESVIYRSIQHDEKQAIGVCQVVCVSAY
jgi:hypothetical protein